MIPLGMLLLTMGALVAGAFLKLFSDHRAFRRELREVNRQLEDVLDIVSSIALSPADEVRLSRVQRRAALGRGREGAVEAPPPAAGPTTEG